MRCPWTSFFICGSGTSRRQWTAPGAPPAALWRPATGRRPRYAPRATPDDARATARAPIHRRRGGLVITRLWQARRHRCSHAPRLLLSRGSLRARRRLHTAKAAAAIFGLTGSSVSLRLLTAWGGESQRPARTGTVPCGSTGHTVARLPPRPDAAAVLVESSRCGARLGRVSGGCVLAVCWPAVRADALRSHRAGRSAALAAIVTATATATARPAAVAATVAAAVTAALAAEHEGRGR